MSVSPSRAALNHSFLTAVVIGFSLPLAGLNAASPGDDEAQLNDLFQLWHMDDNVKVSSKQVYQSDEAPAVVSVIGRAEYQRLGLRTLRDALKYATGIHMLSYPNS